MKTIRTYFFGPATTATARVVGVESRGPTTDVVLDHTIFVCQGGGQPADRGTISGYDVIHVEASESDPGVLVHSLNGSFGLRADDVVDLKIDLDRRVINSRFHTAGHLLAAVVEMVLQGAKARTGHHWPGEARVEFDYDTPLSGHFTQEVEAAIARYIRADLPVRAIRADDGMRFVQIGDLPLVRCGGTHVARLSELQSVALRNVKQKKGMLRIGYELGPKAAAGWIA